MNPKSPEQLEAEAAYIAAIQGKNDPRLMGSSFFIGAKHVDWPSARPACREKQAGGGWPRYWYVEVDFVCAACRREFVWTVDEQRRWFEEYGLRTDAEPRHCVACRRAGRRLKELRREYNAKVGPAREGGAAGDKARIVEILTELLQANPRLATRMVETKGLFERQLSKIRKVAKGSEADG